MKGKFTEEDQALFLSLDEKKQIIQAGLDALNEEIQEAAKVVNAIRGKVAKIKPTLVPIAEMQAALASPLSRDKYFPDLSKNAFIELVKSNV